MFSLFNGFSSVRRTIATVVAVSIGLPVTSQLVTAQEVGGINVIEEITVSVRRREESIRDVPATVHVFTESDIERSNITRAADFVFLTPGMTIVDAAEVADTQVNIRGINGARDAENSYALIIDGILMTNPAALNREYGPLEQIEILKGPQGALYGRNAAAGAIVITTKKPENKLTGQAQASFAEDSSYYAAGNIGGAITPDELWWNFNAEYRTTDGFYNNEYLNRDDITDDFENWAVTGRLVWEPNDDLTVDTKLRYGEVDAASITYNAAFALPVVAAAFDSPKAYEDVNEHDFRFQTNIDSFNEQEAFEFSVKADYDMDWATLTGWFLYSDVDNKLGSDGTSAAFEFFAPYWDSTIAPPPGGPNPGIGAGDPLCSSTTGAFAADPSPTSGLPDPQFTFGLPNFPVSFQGPYLPTTCDGTQYQERNQEDWSFEFRLASSDDQRFRWLGGVYYLDIDREVGVNLGIDRLNPSDPRGQSPVEALYSTDPSNPTEQLVHDQFDSEVIAVFGQLAYDITDTIEGSFALRYDHEDREVKNLVPTPADGAVTEFIDCDGLDAFQPSPLGAIPPGNPYGGGDVINPGLCFGDIDPQDETFDEWQPKVSLTWDATDDWTFFTSWGVGFKSGGFNNQGSAATVDLFINEPLGLVPANQADPAAGLYAEVDIQDAFKEETSSSFELGFKSTLLDSRIRLEGAYYHTEVDDMQFFEFFVGPFGLLRVVENIDEVTIDGFELGATWLATDYLNFFIGGSWIDSEIDKNSVRPDTVGNESPYTAEYTYNLGAYLNIPVTSQMNFFTNLDVSVVGDTWFHVIQENTRPTVFNNLIENRVAFPGAANSEWSRSQRDDYTLVNLRVGLEISENWTVAAFATNLTDEDWLQEVIPAPEFGGSFIHPGTERRWGGEVLYRF